MPTVKRRASEDAAQRAETPAYIGMLKNGVCREERQSAGEQHRRIANSDDDGRLQALFTISFTGWTRAQKAIQLYRAVMNRVKRP